MSVITSTKMEILDDNTLWIDFKGKMIRIENSDHTNNKLMITIHKDSDSDYTEKLIERKNMICNLTQYYN